MTGRRMGRCSGNQESWFGRFFGGRGRGFGRGRGGGRGMGNRFGYGWNQPDAMPSSDVSETSELEWLKQTVKAISERISELTESKKEE